jgi:hypothetical protein
MIRKIDLSGVWRFCLDPENSGETDGYFRSFLPKRINIPGTVSAQKLSPPSLSVSYGYADPLEYSGGAWYQRDFDLPREFNKNDYTVFLTLERTRPSKVWVNGEFAGNSEFVALPQIFNITEFVKKGKNNITILIDNSEIAGKYGNMTAPDGQTNWNGICGKTLITIHNRVYLSDITVDASDGEVRVTAKLNGAKTEDYTAAVISNENFTYPKMSGTAKDGKLDFTYDMGKNYRYFDEFTKAFYTLRISIGAENADVYEKHFGFTRFAEYDGLFYSGHREIFIRGVCSKLCLPDYGAPPCDTVYWVKKMKEAEFYAGVNTWVFIDTVPPEAVFEAADTLGFYVALELSPGMFSEGFTERIKRHFGLHPSLITMPKNIRRLNDYPFFPDFDELQKPKVLYDYRLADELERVKAAGLYDFSDRFYNASALYAKESFKFDVDSTVMNIDLCGYVLPAAKWAKYGKVGGKLGYGSCFLVGDLDKASYTAGQKFRLTLLCCNFTGGEIQFSEVGVRIFDGADLLFENAVKWERPVPHGRKRIGTYDVTIPECEEPNMFRLEIFADNMVNYRDIFVFPVTEREQAGEITVTEDVFEAINAIGAADKNNAADTAENCAKILFCPDTISTDFLVPDSAGKELPVGTLGLLIENRHPIFKGFPCRDYMTARWREIIVNTVSVLLDGQNVTPIIRVIDNAIRNNCLGVLFEINCEGAKIVICTINLQKNKTPPAQALYNSILRYMKSDDFNPTDEMTKNDLRIIFTN